MTNEELLKKACERCEEYSANTTCECQETCPVYELYLAAKYEDFGGWQGNNDFEKTTKTRNDMTKLEVAATKYAEKNHSWLKDALPTLAAVESFERGAEWREKNLWHDAQGDYFPEIDREVIVLCDFGFGGYMICFAHRPKDKGWNDRSISTGMVDHYTPQAYGKGGWNIPDVRWWLDVSIPNMEE